MGQKVPVRGTDVKKQIFRATDQKEFIGLFDGLCMRRHAWQAWGDFVEASAIAVSNSCDKTGPKRNEREERYRQIMAGYEPAEQEIFPQLFGALTEALEQNPDQDFLGDMFMRLELGSHWHGQFFTPYNLCRAIAEIQMGDAKERIQTRGWVSINDCACGAGALLIAARNVMMRAGQDWSSQALFVAQDIDRTAALMCYLQLSLLGCAGYVVIADSLRYPVTGSQLRPTPAPEQDIWYTPTLYLSPVWGYRMLWERIESVQRCATSDPEPETTNDVGTQLTLF